MPSPIDQLCTDLAAEFQRDPRGTRVAEMLGTYAKDTDDWRAFTFFETEGYTRNLVHRCGDFELLLLCWEPGQASPIHDHAGQHCWMAVLEGAVEEVHYRGPQDSQAGPLTEGSARRFLPGQVAFIHDEIALHLVRVADQGRGVSLHLYSNPIDSCRVYGLDTGESSWNQVGYHSVRGELCGAKSAEAVRSDWA